MILLTSSDCPPCKLLKKYIFEKKIEGIDILDISDERGMELAKNLGIRSVPALIYDSGYAVTGLNEIKDALNPQ